jgi:serine/threonine protein kinase
MNENLSSNLIRYLYLQLLKGINQLHDSGFVHGDIKPENLLIDKNFNLVIADFNFAVSLESKASSFSPLVSRYH